MAKSHPTGLFPSQAVPDVEKASIEYGQKIGRAIGAALFHKNPISTKQFQEILMKHQNTKLQDDLIRRLNKEIEAFNKKEAMYMKRIYTLQTDAKDTDEIAQEYYFLEKQLKEEVAQAKIELEKKEKEKSEIRFELDSIMNTLNDLKYENKESFMNYQDQSIQILSNLENFVENPSLREQEIKILQNNLGEFMNEQNTRANKIEEKLATNLTRLEELMTEFKIR